MKLLEDIREIGASIGRNVTLMEVCGGHTHTIMAYGIRDVLPDTVHLISGPGCPVCVSSKLDIDRMIELAKNGVPVATYGDMLRVPGSAGSLMDAKANGATVEMIYSTTDLLELRKRHKDIVFFGIGFETTAPMTTFALAHGIPVYSTHKLIPPAMQALISEDIGVDGFISPGHVATIIGADAFRNISVPQAIAGFDPEQILMAIKAVLESIREGKDDVANVYKGVVSDAGNRKAQEAMEKHFKIDDATWRGLGCIPASGLEVKDAAVDAKIIHKNIIDNVPEPAKTACRCGEVLQGRIGPAECPLFATSCTPQTPHGACMVSEEGSCQIAYRYRG